MTRRDILRYLLFKRRKARKKKRKKNELKVRETHVTLLHDENDFAKKHKILFSTYFLKSES